MSLRNDLLYLIDIKDTVHEALSFVEGCTYESYTEDRMLQRALQRDLEIIGEAAAKVSRDLQHDFPQLPWDKMRGNRNQLIHAYRYIRLQTVWNTVTNDLPALLPAIEDILAQLQGPERDPGQHPRNEDPGPER